jgi:uncharacterized delta-60 repeat protein
MGKACRIVATLAALALAVPGLCLGAAADLDRSLDGDGVRTIDHGGADSGQAVSLQPNGRILVAGYGGPSAAMTVTRLEPDGAADSSFGEDGTSRAVLAGLDFAYALALQPDGKAVIVGEARGVGEAANVAVARLGPGGSPDLAFGEAGYRLIDYLGDDRGRAVALQPDGKILVAGSGGGLNNGMAVTRLTPWGSADPGFGDLGSTILDFGRIARAFGVALQPDGKVVVVGDWFPRGGGRDTVVARLTAGGTIDTGFGDGGARVIDHGGDDGGTAVALQPDGKIVVAGSGGPDTAMLVTRLNPDGSTDQGFDGDGTSRLDLGAADAASAVALQPDGKIVVAGWTGSADLAVGRLRPDGAPDATFDFDGRRTVDVGGVDRARGLAVGPDGRIVIVGETNVGDDVAVVRLEGDPPRAGGVGSGPGGAAARAAPGCAGRRATIVGTPRRDVLRGTGRADVIVARGGDDVVLAGSGRDLVCGGPGRDRLLGQAGADRLLGQGGRDRLLGGPGADVLSGGAARDSCLGGGGLDRVSCERRRGR